MKKFFPVIHCEDKEQGKRNLYIAKNNGRNQVCYVEVDNDD